MPVLPRLQCDAPYRSQSGCENLIDSHARLQSSHGCKLNTVAWVVKLTYLHVAVKCESLLGGHGKARCILTTAVWFAFPSEIGTLTAFVKASFP